MSFKAIRENTPAHEILRKYASAGDFGTYHINLTSLKDLLYVSGEARGLIISLRLPLFPFFV